MPALKRQHLKVVDSTNNHLRQQAETNLILTADFQTAGRGQGENRWESAEGENLLFSIKVSPENLPARDFFLMSMVGALALKDALSARLDDITLKWPNDVYWRDRKLSGTLIETTISGKNLLTCILGIGINVNQREFLSNAPNPVSIWQITNQESDRESLLADIITAFEHHYSRLLSGQAAAIANDYNAALYRRTGFHPYEDHDGRFEAKIIEVKTNGQLLLEDRDQRQRSYEFKQLKFII